MPPAPRKRTTPAQPEQPETTQLDTSDFQSADPERAAQETTPIHDEVAAQLKEDLANADPEDVTLFEEDENPLDHVGDLAEESDDNETKENA